MVPEEPRRRGALRSYVVIEPHRRGAMEPAITPHVFNPQDYVNHMFKRP
jgi:hypothetical protein